jgi:glutathione S-transferase
MTAPYVLYDYLPSGNGYKVRLVCRHLGLNYRLVQMDIKAGATRTPEFLAKNPNGRIPLLELPGGGFLFESHAIISYLAEGSDLVPDERLERALMWQWMCFEQYNLEPNIGSARFWIASLRKTPQELGERYVRALADGNEALAMLEKHLTGRRFLVADRFSLADIALYAYTHVAPEGGFPLDPYPAVRAWLGRVAERPRHAPISAP